MELVEQSVYFVEKKEKRFLLEHLLQDEAITRTLVFSRTKHGANRIVKHLVRHDINVIPGFRQSDFFEALPPDEEWPASSKVARLVLSVIYHLAPLLGSRRLNGMLLLNSLRQRHPFDVTWGADFLVKCYGMSSLVRLLLAAAQGAGHLSPALRQAGKRIIDLVPVPGQGILIPAHVAPQQEVFVHRQVDEDTAALRHLADP